MTIKRFNSVGGFSVGNSSIVSVIDANANVIASSITAQGNVSFSGSNVTLGDVENVHITGGSSGQVLTTDGAGVLTWSTSEATANAIFNGTSNVSIAELSGNVNVSVAGNADVLVVTPTGVDIEGTANVTTAIVRDGRNVPTFVYQANTPPTSPLVGDQWYNTANGILFEYLNDGTSSQWVDMSSIPSPVLARAWDFVPPSASSFTLASGEYYNMIITDDNDVGMQMDGNAPTTNGALRIAYKPLTNGALSWTFTVKLKRFVENMDYCGLGLVMQDSVSGKLIRFVTQNNSGLQVLYDNSLNENSTVPWSSSITPGIALDWFRIRHDNSQYYFEVSPDGKMWTTLYSAAASAFLPSPANRIGFVADYYRSSGSHVLMTCPYMTVTGPGA